MQVEGQRVESLLSMPATGARVRNAYQTCLILGDSLAKVRLIPDGVAMRHLIATKDLLVKDGDASD